MNDILLFDRPKNGSSSDMTNNLSETIAKNPATSPSTKINDNHLFDHTKNNPAKTLSTNITDKELYELCQQYGREARRWKNKFVSLLPEVFKRRLYRKKGFCSIYEFAAKIGGVSRNIVDEVIRFDEKFREMPKLKSLIPDVGLSKLRTVAGIANKETDSFWANKVETMTRNALTTYIKDIRPGTEDTATANLSLFNEQNKSPESQNLKTQNQYTSTGAARVRFGLNLDEETIFQLRLLKQKFEKELGETLCWNEVMKKAAQKLLTEKKVRKYTAKPSTSRHIPVQKRQEQPKICTVPGCNRPATLIHHPDRYSTTKSHDRLASICKAHHELAHRGFIDEQNDFRTLIRPIIDPIKRFADKKMLSCLHGM